MHRELVHMRKGTIARQYQIQTTPLNVVMAMQKVIEQRLAMLLTLNAGRPVH